MRLRLKPNIGLIKISLRQDCRIKKQKIICLGTSVLTKLRFPLVGGKSKQDGFQFPVVVVFLI